MKKILGLCLFFLFVNFSYAKNTADINSISMKLNKNTKYNDDCKIDNYNLLKSDIAYDENLKALLSDFGSMSIDDFDMGECINVENFRDGKFSTMYWQKNKDKLGHHLDLFVSYDFVNQRMLAVIMDNDLNTYLIGDKSDDLKTNLQNNNLYANNFKKSDFNSNFSYLDLKEYDPNSEDTQEVVVPINYDEVVKWDISCKKDIFDDTKMCFMNSGDVMVSIINGKLLVYIGGNHYPNTESALKVDKNSTIYGFEGHSRNPILAIEQMKKGNRIYTRYKRWPNNYNIDNELDLTGFTKKFNEMIDRYKSL